LWIKFSFSLTKRTHARPGVNQLTAIRAFNPITLTDQGNDSTDRPKDEAKEEIAKGRPLTGTDQRADDGPDEGPRY